MIPILIWAVAATLALVFVVFTLGERLRELDAQVRGMYWDLSRAKNTAEAAWAYCNHPNVKAVMFPHVPDDEVIEACSECHGSGFTPSTCPDSGEVLLASEICTDCGGAGARVCGEVCGRVVIEDDGDI